MELKSMKIDPAEQEPETMMSEPSPYPYGLCLRLEEDSVEKLGLDELPEVGTEVTIQAKAIVRSTNEMNREGEMYRSLELQITDMGMSTGKKKDIQAALYGGETESKGAG